jgi:uncharacterized damage-inducible protein DinB
MPGTLQTYLTTAIPRATADLEAALLRLPEDKRAWCAGGTARTALNMVAECVLMNEGTAELLASRRFPEWNMETYQRTLDETAALEWSVLQARLEASTKKLVEVVATLRDEDLDAIIETPWSPTPLSSIAMYPFWNTCYHEGQINFIASILGCLE